MSLNYLNNGLNYNINKSEYHHKVLKLTTPKIKKLEKKLEKLKLFYISNPTDELQFTDYNIRFDILTSQIEALKKL